MGNIASEKSEGSIINKAEGDLHRVPLKRYISKDAKSTQEIQQFLEVELSETSRHLQDIKRSDDFEKTGREDILKLLRTTSDKLRNFLEQTEKRNAAGGEAVEHRDNDKVRKKDKSGRKIKRLKSSLNSKSRDLTDCKEQIERLKQQIAQMNRGMNISVVNSESLEGQQEAPMNTRFLPDKMRSVFYSKESTEGLNMEQKSIEQNCRLEESDKKSETDKIYLKKKDLKTEKETEELKETNETLRSEMEILGKKYKELDCKTRELTQQNEELLTRLSKIAGQKLTEDNPAITDLSDSNRPTKLGEMYSEIYDNEWTDAFEELNSAGYSEEESIETLLLTLLNVVQFCQAKSTNLLEKTREAVDILFEEYTASYGTDSPRHLTMPRKSREHWGKIVKKTEAADIVLQRRWKPKVTTLDFAKYRSSILAETPETVTSQLKIFRKEVAEAMVPLLQRAYLTAGWSEIECIPALKPYIKKCLFLGWMMAVQSPSLVLSICQEGEVFNKDMYREYTKSGAKVEYVVWPALLLHENGPMIGKGVAQGMKK